MKPADVTAVLVTRGDQPAKVAEIRESLIFDHVVVWDNTERYDAKTAGRYYALHEFAVQPVIYFQDDDVIVPAETQRRLCDAYMPDVVISNYGHGEDAAGYDDLPLVGGGAVLDVELPWHAANRYLEQWPLDDDFLYYCDFAIGVLYHDFRHLHLPFEIDLPIAQAPERLVNQPWAADMKARVTEQARHVRDMGPG